MAKLNIAIITGGNVAERGISLKSAVTIEKHLDSKKYNKWIIDLVGTDFMEQKSEAKIDKNDFSLIINNEKIKFDLAYLILHGHPAEDGCLQGYFDIIGLPYTGCDHFVSALTFNKQATKNYLQNYQIPMAPSQLLRKEKSVNWVVLEKMELPLFVKPNKNGSSYGVTKVEKLGQLKGAVEKAFEFDDEVVVEGFLAGREFSTGVIRSNGKVTALPVTEIISENAFFDFEAKYLGESQEITPADLSPELTKKCQDLTEKIYEILGCQGIARVDYILVNNTFNLLEVNTIPGFSEASIVPQQTIAHGWTISELLDMVVAEAFKK